MQTITLKKIALPLLLTASLFAGGNIDPVMDASSVDINIQKARTVSTAHSLQRIYIDSFSDLMWQDAKYTLKEKEVYESGNGHFSLSTDFSKTGSFSYSEKYCSELNYAAFENWRIPTLSELQQILRTNDNTQRFYYKQVGYFWAKTTKDEGTSVHTEEGYDFPGRGSRNRYIRCVREMNEVDPQN